jgi:hypothetical protein
MIAAAAALIMVLIFFDMFRPRRHVDTAAPAAAGADSPRPAPAPAPLPPPPAPEPAPTSATQGTDFPVEPPPDAREPTYIELLARSETRRRIRASGSSTYLPDMLAVSNDSMLRRWESRKSSPIRVWFAPTNVANFKPAFLDAVRTAFGEWTAWGVPVRFDFDGDSTNAEVTVRWRIQFEIERTGQTDVSWDQNGQIRSAVITLATFDPKGRQLDTDDIRVVAAHEVGHMLGLDHSRDSTDIMYPTAKVRELSSRDIRTVMLLYQLTPGSFR